jgi:hypothetical protein
VHAHDCPVCGDFYLPRITAEADVCLECQHAGTPVGAAPRLVEPQRHLHAVNGSDWRGELRALLAS